MSSQLFAAVSSLRWFSKLVSTSARRCDEQFARHVSGMETSAGQIFLVDSLDQLKSWLSQTENLGNPAGHYLAAYLNSYLRLSPLNLADIARRKPKQLELDLVPPQGGVLKKLESTLLLTFHGMMVQIVIMEKLSKPLLGMFVEQGEENTKQWLIDSGIAQSKALAMIRNAKTELKRTKVSMSHNTVVGYWRKFVRAAFLCEAFGFRE